MEYEECVFIMENSVCFNDNITCDYIHKYTKKYYDIKIYKYFSFKGYIKIDYFYYNH